VSFVYCVKCHARSNAFEVTHDSCAQDRAIKAWNTRVQCYVGGLNEAK